ncbi:type I-E CRISPR-associated protein Cas6/Cse3/CasE [Nitrospirillum sp. BR 11828]|uniref:type I-E CRISPR-associated protein Cas6/Cse3/CasE n=1 Tax=Nitrospirillum sp. BR 11828 TaxID=3104325 RepID=UPI002ACAFF62|nr:type I-E CRISPR-associated protein Cas6/Cse3/CasE [Nitrospirillum sp. BR 11828]MDZ5649987.1 type I-E CRISPR-associated protein Cas6/Cse3/CasE [Nitrospirillum sp. BR 11828]
MSFITRAHLRQDAPAARNLARLLLDQSQTDQGHRLVWTLFGDDPDAARDFLYRETEPGRFLVVSRRPPLADTGIWVVETKPYAPAPPEGGAYAFSLRANPAASVARPGQRGLRVDAVMHARTRKGEALTVEEKEAAALSWLYARADRLGVAFEAERCSATGYRQVAVPRKGAQPARFAVADYDGVLHVRDPKRLADALLAGVGKARAYGCGLLLLRPLPPV